MTEPRIRYLQTPDGVNIAYTTMGEGPALIMGPAAPFCHLEAEWWVPTLRRWHERLAEKMRLVRYDPRGCGLSDRDVGVITLETRVKDLEAVIDHLGLDRVAVNGYGVSGPVAITYAVQHPDRVSHLILWDSYVRASDLLGFPQLQGLTALMNSDWELFTETVASVFFGWSAGDPAREFAKYLRECVTAEEARSILGGPSWIDVDVTAILDKVEAPTLVVRSRAATFPGVEAARSLASAIPDASLTTLDGVWLTSEEITDAASSAVLGFLGVDEGDELKMDDARSGAFRTILFTDVEGSTALTDRLGDTKARDLLREHERITREALKAHGGSEVKTMGDGFMASFSSATKALECAIAIQRAFAERNESVEEPIKVRIGLNAGEPIAEDDPAGRGDLFGTAVNMAARIASKAEGGEILASDVVRQLVAGKEFLFSDRGDTELRGFEDSVRVYEVRWREND